MKKNIFAYIFMVLVLPVLTSCMMANEKYLSFKSVLYLLDYFESPETHSDERASEILNQFGLPKEFSSGKVISIIKEFETPGSISNEQALFAIEDNGWNSIERIQFTFNEKPESIKLYAVIATINYLGKKLYVKRPVCEVTDFNYGNYFYESGSAYDCMINLDKSWDSLWDEVIAKYPDSSDYLRNGYLIYHKDCNFVSIETGIMMLAEVEYEDGKTATIENVCSFWSVSCRRAINVITGNKNYTDASLNLIRSTELYKEFPKRDPTVNDPYGSEWRKKALANLPMFIK